MYSYALLEKGCYYLIQEKEEGPVGLIKVNMETDHCMYVSKYADTQLTVWKKKTDKKDKDADTAVATAKIPAIPTIPTDAQSPDNSGNPDLGSVVPQTGYAGQGAATAANQFLSQAGRDAQPKSS